MSVDYDEQLPLLYPEHNTHVTFTYVMHQHFGGSMAPVSYGSSAIHSYSSTYADHAEICLHVCSLTIPVRLRCKEHLVQHHYCGAKCLERAMQHRQRKLPGLLCAASHSWEVSAIQERIHLHHHLCLLPLKHQLGRWQYVEHQRLWLVRVSL